MLYIISQWGCNMRDFYDEPPSRRSPPPPPRYKHKYSNEYLYYITFAIIILVGGGIVTGSVGFLEDPEEVEYDHDDYNKYKKEREEYLDNIRWIQTLGNMIQYIGIMCLAIGIFLGAMKDENLPINVKLGMLIAFGLIVGLKISSSIIIPYYG